MLPNETKKTNLVIGLGKSGFWAAKYLHSEEKKVIVIDSGYSERLIEYKNKLENLGISVYLNKKFTYKEILPWLENIDSVIISPAINMENVTVKRLKKEGIKVHGEINLAWKKLKDINWVGITGTNGKTTVTHLLSHILCQNNLFAPSAGNIGIPLCKYALNSKANKEIDWIVAELSSYQIEIATEIKPKIGIWTTFTPDHLERHKTLDNYFKIKNNLLKNSKLRIYNYDDKFLRESAELLLPGIWVSSNNNSSLNNKCDYWIDSDGFIVERGIRLFGLDIYILKGNHNIQNLLLAIAAARKIGLSSSSIKNSIISYVPLPHRLETIYKDKDIEIINDSKATNFDASIAGINSINGKSIIIVGGRMKNGDSKEWIKAIIKKFEAIFLYGESAEDLKILLIKGGFTKKIFIFTELKELTINVMRYSQDESVKVLLFSPSCSSFDQFDNYETRGNYFKSLIKNHFLSKGLKG